MHKIIFTDKFGNFAYFEPDKAFFREDNYAVIKKDSQVVCLAGSDMLYSFPHTYDIELKQNPSFSFSSVAYIMENGIPIKELQNYNVYEVEDADLSELPMIWCDINDILVNKINFNCTQKVGVKNLFVRAKK